MKVPLPELHFNRLKRYAFFARSISNVELAAVFGHLDHGGALVTFYFNDIGRNLILDQIELDHFIIHMIAL